MNRIGRTMLEHYRLHRPSELATIEDPDRYFTNLGEQMFQEMLELADTIAGPDTSPNFLENVGRLNEAKLTAESEVFRHYMEPISPE